jgi:hypothetical protein
MEVVQKFIDSESLIDVETAGQGLECLVFKAQSPTYSNVVLKIPRVKVYQNANDFSVEAKSLIHQELRIYGLLQDGHVPVPEAYKYLEQDGYPAMLCEYVNDDGTSVSDEEMGRVAALIHVTKGEDLGRMVAMETGDVFFTMEQRMKRRFGVLARSVPEASGWIHDWNHIHNILEGLKRFPSSLLHMDFRDVNLRYNKGRISAVIDWTNALIGPAVIDVYRTLEFSPLGDGFIKGYTGIANFPQITAQEECFLRLDAALVLALVFKVKAPDAAKGEIAVARVKELAQRLQTEV